MSSGRSRITSADRESMSVRTFTRRFRAEVGTGPRQWITAQRLLRAHRLPESTDAPVELVAMRAGFGTPGSLRQHFHTSLGVSPSAYRRTFRESTLGGARAEGRGAAGRAVGWRSADAHPEHGTATATRLRRSDPATAGGTGAPMAVADAGPRPALVEESLTPRRPLATNR